MQNPLRYAFCLLLIPIVFRLLESVNGPWPIPFKWPEVENEQEQPIDYDTRSRTYNEPKRPHNLHNPANLDFDLLCRGSSSCVPTDVKIPRKIASAPAVGVSTCSVAGNFAAETEAITCFAERKRIIGSVRGKSPAEIDKYCGGTNKFNSVYAMSRGIRIRLRDMRHWTFVMVGWDPLERFVHGFVKHCYLAGGSCYTCGDNIKCFTEVYLQRLLQFAMYNKENARQITDIDWDLFPQTWMCDIDEWHHRYRVVQLSRNLTNVTSELSDIFGEKNRFAIRSIMSSGVHDQFSNIYEHPKFDQYLQEVSNDTLFKMFIAKMYHNDYKWLGLHLKL